MNLADSAPLFLLGRAAEPLRPVLISRKDKIPLADTLASTPWSAFWTLPAPLSSLPLASSSSSPPATRPPKAPPRP